MVLVGLSVGSPLGRRRVGAGLQRSLVCQPRSLDCRAESGRRGLHLAPQLGQVRQQVLAPGRLALLRVDPVLRRVQQRLESRTIDQLAVLPAAQPARLQDEALQAVKRLGARGRCRVLRGQLGLVRHRRSQPGLAQDAACGGSGRWAIRCRHVHVRRRGLRPGAKERCTERDRGVVQLGAEPALLHRAKGRTHLRSKQRLGHRLLDRRCASASAK
mmetsp:Transcript_7152/g.23505  ORF Transcript_7152/g.23505 Transcript_7152/m.23505 type:complete len:215 (+) Transcript_7152:790-1434(+)